MKGTGTTTLEVIRGIAESFSTYPVEVVEEPAQYRFSIWYVGTIGEVAHQEDLVAAINALKPAHLAWDVKYQQELECPVWVGCFPRQGDLSILWEVDCR